MTGRIGVACKWLAADGSNHAKFRFRSLNKSNFLRGGPSVLREVAMHNAVVLLEVVRHLAKGPERNRMFRIGNHSLPCLTLPEASRVWRDAKFVQELSSTYEEVGRLASRHGVRLSTHPDQFIVPNSESADVRRRSIEELDAWSEWAARIGTRDFCINVHLGPRLDGTVRTLARSWRRARLESSEQANEYLTVENNDSAWTARDLWVVANESRIRPVVDPHHHWCVTGEWLHAEEIRELVVPHWAHVIPKVHFSLPRGSYFSREDVDRRGLPVLDECRGPTRPHANRPWAPGAARYTLELLEYFDVMNETKGKNLARDDLWAQIDAEKRDNRVGRAQRK